MMGKDKTILSLFDHSGFWSKPYKDAGYNVIRADIQDGVDIFWLMTDVISQSIEAEQEGVVLKVYGVLAAPPCTDFSSSGAWCWENKKNQPANYDGHRTIEFDNTIEHSIGMVYATLEIITRLNPVFYCIENPVGRIGQLIPDLGQPWFFHPCDFGDPYTKKTGLYGKFNKPMKAPVLPLFGSMITNKLSSKQKDLRSRTPSGFAKAFFEANQ